MTQYVCKPQVIEENLLLEATGVNLSDQRQFWSAVSAWVALLLRGSRCSCVGRAAQVGRAGANPPCKTSYVWVAQPRWVAQAQVGSRSPETLATPFQNLKSAFNLANTFWEQMKLVHELCLAFIYFTNIFSIRFHFKSNFKPTLQMFL